MASKTNAMQTERQKLSLDGKQKAPIMALAEENLREDIAKACKKSVRSMRAQGNKETDFDFHQAVVAVVGGCRGSSRAWWA